MVNYLWLVLNACKVGMFIDAVGSATARRVRSYPNASAQADGHTYATGGHTCWIPYADTGQQDPGC